MKKYFVLAAAFVIILAALSCKDLKRNNPYDPSGTAYGGITYKEQVWYPDSATIASMIVLSGYPVLAGYNSTDGDCIMKITGVSTYYAIGSTGDVPGTFRAIKDICADDFGNIYVVDNKAMVQTVSNANIMGYWPITYTTGIDNLSIECLNSSIFITNNGDRTVTKYTLGGTLVDTLTLSFTSYGSFAPGKIFKGSGSLYVVNSYDKSIVVRLTDTLVVSGTYDFQDDIIDGTEAGTQIQLTGAQAAYKVNSDMGLVLKWGNFGVGTGKILNGKLVAYDSAGNFVYVLDGFTIKKFGE